MKHSIQFGDGPADVIVTTVGVASLDGLDSVVVDLLDDPRYLPGMSLLFDYTRLDWSTLDAGDFVRRVHVPLKEADLTGPARIAAVSSDERLVEAGVLRDDEPTWRAFRTVEEACRWLAVAEARS